MTAIDGHRMLLLVGWALHYAFVGYVVTGTLLVALSAAGRGNAPPGRLETVLADWLPAGLSGAITAGIVPLLFVQTLHQEAFYSASLLLFPRAVPLLPLLIAGFYLLYVAKAAAPDRPRRRALAAGISLACWVFAAFTWSSTRVLADTPDAWTAAYASYGLTWWSDGLGLRIAGWLALTAPLCAAAAVHQVEGDAPSTRTLGRVAVAGSLMAAACLAGYVVVTGAEPGVAGWLTLGGLGLQIVTWLPAAMGRPFGRDLRAAATAGAAITLVGAATAREILRAPVEEARAEQVTHADAIAVFLALAVAVTLTLTYVLREVRRDLRRTDA